MRIAMTGPEGDGGPLGAGLRALGAATLGAPLLEVRPLPAAGGLAARLRDGEFDLVAFPSPRAVDAVGPVPGEAGEWPAAVAVGPETAARARAAGFRVLVEGQGPGAEGLLASLDREGTPLRGRRVLLPASDRARPALTEGLRARGARVEAVAAYAVADAPDLPGRVAALAAAGAEAVLLASPSAAAALAGGAADGAEGTRDRLPPLLALGPTTAAAMEAHGLRPAAVATAPTAAGLFSAMEEVGMSTGTPGGFPRSRPRRLRRTGALRAMVRETRLSPDALVAPMFVVPGEGVREPVPSMPGVERVSADGAVEDARKLAALGVPAVILFGIPAAKDAEGSGAWDPEGPVCRATAALKETVPDLQVWADICLCEYADHGHCGLLDGEGRVRNDATLPLLARAAVACARAGADAVAPSDMMDGRVAAIRAALDGEGLSDTLLVSYAVKYASAFYGPFRDAAGSVPRSGDRRAYQMDPANAREALREAALDEAEGADVILVKPALAYLDVIRRVREATTLPVAAYNVSGEYAMVKAAAERGWIDGERAVLETLTAIRRAGADLIVTYHAAEAARLLA